MLALVFQATEYSVGFDNKYKGVVQSWKIQQPWTKRDKSSFFDQHLHFPKAKILLMSSNMKNMS